MKLLSLISRSVSRQFLKYLFVGVWNTFFSLAIFDFFLTIFGNSYYEVALLSAFLISTIQSYLSQRYTVWRSFNSTFRSFMAFQALTLVQFLATSLILYIGVGIFRYKPLYVQIPTSLCFAFLSFLYLKLRVFRISKLGDFSEKE